MEYFIFNLGTKAHRRGSSINDVVTWLIIGLILDLFVIVASEQLTELVGVCFPHAKLWGWLEPSHVGNPVSHGLGMLGIKVLHILFKD